MTKAAKKFYKRNGNSSHKYAKKSKKKICIFLADFKLGQNPHPHHDQAKSKTYRIVIQNANFWQCIFFVFACCNFRIVDHE